MTMSMWMALIDIVFISTEKVVTGVCVCGAGKNLEHGLRKAGLLKYVRELDGNDEDGIEGYLNDASMYARGMSLKCTLSHR